MQGYHPSPTTGKPCNISNFELKSIFQLQYFSWLLIHIFARALVGAWSHFEAVLHTQTRGTRFRPPLKTCSCSTWTHLWASNSSGKGKCMRSCTPALEQELAQTYTSISTPTTMRTTQKESENTASSMCCFRSLVISQIIVPLYLLEEFGRKRRDCWKLAFKSGFPWERWPCSEVCGITW